MSLQSPEGSTRQIRYLSKKGCTHLVILFLTCLKFLFKLDFYFILLPLKLLEDIDMDRVSHEGVGGVGLLTMEGKITCVFGFAELSVSSPSWFPPLPFCVCHIPCYQVCCAREMTNFWDGYHRDPEQNKED